MTGLDVAPVDTTRASVGHRPLRADAARNRQKLLTVAAEAFTKDGVDVSLEDIARTAGVGIGTLYRNFPTREALVLGVYRQQIAELDAASRDLAGAPQPAEALHAWMQSFVGYAAVKRGMIGLLKSMMATEGDLFTETRQILHEAAGRLLTRAAEAGEIRADIGPAELIRAMGGVCMATDQPAAAPVAVTLVDLIFDGLRFRA